MCFGCGGDRDPASGRRWAGSRRARRPADRDLRQSAPRGSARDSHRRRAGSEAEQQPLLPGRSRPPRGDPAAVTVSRWAGLVGLVAGKGHEEVQVVGDQRLRSPIVSSSNAPSPISAASKGADRCSTTCSIRCTSNTRCSTSSATSPSGPRARSSPRSCWRCCWPAIHRHPATPVGGPEHPRGRTPEPSGQGGNTHHGRPVDPLHPGRTHAAVGEPRELLRLDRNRGDGRIRHHRFRRRLPESTSATQPGAVGARQAAPSGGRRDSRRSPAPGDADRRCLRTDADLSLLQRTGDQSRAAVHSVRRLRAGRRVERGQPHRRPRQSGVAAR